MANNANRVFAIVARRSGGRGRLRHACLHIELRGGAKGQGAFVSGHTSLNNAADYRAKVEEMLAGVLKRDGIERWQVRNLGPYGLVGEFPPIIGEGPRLLAEDRARAVDPTLHPVAFPPAPAPRVEPLEELARAMVGDDGAPNVFFVTDGGAVVMVTTDESAARRLWRTLAARRPLQECALEDRQTGVVACVEPAGDEDGAPLVRQE